MKRLKLRNKQRTFGGTVRADLPDSAFAGPDRSFPIKTAQDVRDAARSLGRTNHDKAAVKRGIIRRARAIGAVNALPEAWREKEAPSATPDTHNAHGSGGLFANPAISRSPLDFLLWRKARRATRRRYATTKTPAARAFARDWYDRRGGLWTEKAPNYGARGGQTIAGDLGRGDDGKFTSASSGGDGKSKDEKPKGSAKKPKSPSPEQQARQAQRDRERAEDRAQRAADRKLRLTRQAQRDQERAEDRKQRAADRKQQAEEKRQRELDKQRQQVKPEGKPKGGGGGKKSEQNEGSDKLDKQIDSLRNLANLFGRGKTDGFVVFKDAKNEWRWIARTTTAFQDRDDEIISTKALIDDVARTDRDGRYGPLRWWHIGNPDPNNADAPWGSGLDLGWCDFAAVSGHSLIESGTFKSAEIARVIAAKADQLGLSPGFFHTSSEPDAHGVFHHIRRFERSLAPKNRVSNPFTAFAVASTATKGDNTVHEQKIAQLKALGLSGPMIADLLTDTIQTEKTAEASGVRYKEATSAELSQIATLKAQLAALEKALGGAKKAEPEEEADEADEETLAQERATEAAVPAVPADVAAAVEAVEETEKLDAPDELEDFDDAFDESTLRALIREECVQAITQALAPLTEQLALATKLEKQIGGLQSDLKAAFGGVATKAAAVEKAVEAEQSAVGGELAALKAKLDALQGTTTRYQASTALDTVTQRAEELAEKAKPVQAPLAGSLGDISNWISQVATTSIG